MFRASCSNARGFFVLKKQIFVYCFAFKTKSFVCLWLLNAYSMGFNVGTEVKVEPKSVWLLVLAMTVTAVAITVIVRNVARVS